MIRTACAWVLVVLAASPVTAPFCACDLHDVVAYAATSRTQPSVLHVTRPEVCVESGTGGVSLRLSNREPATECRDAFVMFPFTSVSFALRDMSGHQFVRHVIHRRPARPTVLRV
jgi:hypothetical protein